MQSTTHHISRYLPQAQHRGSLASVFSFIGEHVRPTRSHIDPNMDPKPPADCSLPNLSSRMASLVFSRPTLLLLLRRAAPGLFWRHCVLLAPGPDGGAPPCALRTAPANLLRNAPEHCPRSARLFGCTDPPADSHQLLQEVMRMASPGLMQVFLAKTHSVSCCVAGKTAPGSWRTTGQASCTRPLFWTTCSFNNRLPNCLARKATHSAGCSTITMLALLIGWIRGARFATLPRRGTSQTLCA